MSRARPTRPLPFTLDDFETDDEVAEFWSNVAILPSVRPCWEWLGRKKSGYGVHNVRGRSIGAHRVAYYFIYGQDPDRWLLHSCDNSGCVNPRHLRMGDALENSRDREAAERMMALAGVTLTRRRTRRRGESHHHTTILDVGATAIREAYWRGASVAEVALGYGVKHHIVNAIVSRRSFACGPRSPSEPEINEIAARRRERYDLIKSDAAHRAWEARRARRGIGESVSKHVATVGPVADLGHVNRSSSIGRSAVVQLTEVG